MSLPATMTCIDPAEAGGPEVLQPVTRPLPVPAAGEHNETALADWGLDAAAIEALKPDLYHVIALLESGDARVAEPQDGGWKVNEWLKKAVLLYFRCHDMDVMGEPGNPFWDKVPLRFENYDAEDFRRLGLEGDRT